MCVYVVLGVYNDAIIKRLFPLPINSPLIALPVPESSPFPLVWVRSGPWGWQQFPNPLHRRGKTLEVVVFLVS